jgi:hypothetical protein
MEGANENQERIDCEHLNLLAIFHYVVGALEILFSSFAILHLSLGIAMIVNPQFFDRPNGAPDPAQPFIGYLFAIVGGLFVLFGWTMGGLTIYSGRCIHKRRRRMFSMIVAGITCLWIPFGTTLGVFTIIVLARPSVQRLYAP